MYARRIGMNNVTAFLVCLISLQFTAPVFSGTEEQSLEFIAGNSQFTPDERFLLHIRSVPGSWIRVETSSDLKKWEELVNLRVFREATVYFDETSSKSGRHFYRLSDNPTSFAESRTFWREHAIGRYRFQLQWAGNESSAFWDESVTVTAEGDSKTVSGIKVNQNGESAFSEEEFPDIGELFELLIFAEISEAREMHVSYEPELGFPTRIWIDHNPHRDALEGFVITDFEILPDQ